MPDQSSRTSSRDLAFQAFTRQFGGAEGTPTGYTAPSDDRYDADRPTNVPSASSNSNQAGQDASLRFNDFGAQQNSLGAQTPGQFPGYGFSPGGPLVWDWNSSIEFPDFANHYEPQGELVQELENPNVPANDFSLPLPVTNAGSSYQPAQQIQTPNSTSAQNPLSPPPKPPTRPAVQTGMKRKAESEPNSAVSQAVSFSGEAQPNPAKRPNKSRSSSSASITSPAVATSADARRSSTGMTQITTAVASTETAPQTNSTTNNEQQKKASKGTGPQGRVIDFSKPRRIVESPGGADHLPAGKVFPIQIGSELFRLSGASLSSDGMHCHI